MSSLKAPFKDLLPPLSSEELAALKASIAEDGVREPICIDEAGNILDGHNRHAIAPDAPTRVVSGLSEAGQKAFVLAANLQRRNLSPEQKAELRQTQIAVAREMKAEGETLVLIAIRLGVDPSTVSRCLTPNMQVQDRRNDRRVKLDGDDEAEIHDRVHAGESQAQVAADFGISQQHASRVVTHEAKRRKREQDLNQQRADIESGKIDLADGPFDVIVYDPPWKYETKYNPGHWTGRAANPYPEMSLDEIAADGDREIVAKAADDSVLWLWTTNKHLRSCFPLLDRCGFAEKTYLVWVKDAMKTGRWLRGKHELCVMAVRGSPGIKLTNQTTVLEAKAREHSRKPEEFYPLVESLCEGPRRYDRFAREQRAGWFCGGNDISKFGEGGEAA